MASMSETNIDNRRWTLFGEGKGEKQYYTVSSLISLTSQMHME